MCYVLHVSYNIIYDSWTSLNLLLFYLLDMVQESDNIKKHVIGIHTIYYFLYNLDLNNFIFIILYLYILVQIIK